MTEHEKASMEAAMPRKLANSYEYMSYSHVWRAARAYEPPTVCGERSAGGRLRCALTAGHDCDHRTEINCDGTYIGWPREQEPEPDERCAFWPTIISRCNLPAEHWVHGLNADNGLGLTKLHAFVSAKEATKCDYHSTGVCEKCE